MGGGSSESKTRLSQAMAAWKILDVLSVCESGGLFRAFPFGERVSMLPLSALRVARRMAQGTNHAVPDKNWAWCPTELIISCLSLKCPIWATGDDCFLTSPANAVNVSQNPHRLCLGHA